MRIRGRRSSFEVERQPIDAAGSPEGPALSERTVDVSAGGVRVANAAAARLGSRHLVTLELPDGRRVGPVPGRVVRVEDASLGLRFDAVGEEDRRALALLVLGWHRARLDAPAGG